MVSRIPPRSAAGEARMSQVDTAWLRMDSPANLMMILGVWILKPALSYATVRRRIAQRLLQYPRFAQRVQHDLTGVSWVPDPDFRIAHHVVREHLPPYPADGAQQALQDRLAELATRPLPMDRPLWQFHLVEEFDGGSALLVRIHHCMADGLALLAVTQSLVDEGPPPPVRRRPARRGPLASAETWLAHSLVQPLAGLAVKALDKAGSGGLARLGYQLAQDAAALALLPDDSPTRLKGTPGPAKRVAWCQPIPLHEVKAVGRALNCSVNDVLLSCVAGAIGGYLRSLGDDTTGTEIRAMVPVNLREPAQAHELGNHFGLAPLLLPIGLAHPLERLYEVRRRMRAMKGSQQPLLAYALLAVAGLLVKPAQDLLLGYFSRKTTAVMTNVAGSPIPLHFCGATLTQSLFWVPQSGTVGLGVSILSYGGGVQFGIISDAGLCPQPQRIIERFAPEFAQLTLLTLMLPWGE
jgi:diacylglycerol O-acyltransferase